MQYDRFEVRFEHDKEKMERIWAPWRIDYVVGGEKEPGCIFCTKPAADQDDVNLIIHRGRGAFTMMNKFPYTNGHVLVSPYKHVEDICLLDPEENSLISPGTVSRGPCPQEGHAAGGFQYWNQSRSCCRRRY